MISNPTQKSVMDHSFSQIPKAEIQRSSFNRSSGYKTTFDSGYLVPFFVDETLPGDTFNLNMTSMSRLATPLVPFMDNLVMDFFFFAVPLRLVWDNFQKFMGERDNPDDSTDYLVPQITAPVGGFPVGCICDYMGLPTGIDNLTVNNLHGRAYNLIYNEWFRDQNLQDSVQVDKDDGPDTPSDYVILKRGKRHDYFTSSLPWPQKGDSVQLPLGDSALIAHDGANNDILTVKAPTIGSSDYTLQAGTTFVQADNNTSGVTPLYADLSTATAATINSIREAFQLQRMLERDARGGTRYTEIIRSHYNVHSPDQRLQRPEYLGGGSSNIHITPIAQTVPAGPGSYVGTLAAIGAHNSTGVGFTKSFTEHCVIIGLLNVRADLTYQQGVNRMWSRQTRFDYYWPALAHLGEQEVLSKEIYADGTADDEDVFGYQERFAEYRYKPSLITGKLRSSDPQSLDSWHLSQDFSTRPVLNSDFITEDPPVDRVIAVVNEPQFIFDSYISLNCTRPMPTYSVPGQIDHF